MDYVDLCYRTYIDYKKTTAKNSTYVKKRKELASCAKSQERLELTKYDCKIDEEWIDKIDEGLKFIGKAIDETRQFITSTGEVVQIDKVKNVSQESVIHLAKHSNLITTVPENGDIIPDKLYTVERLSDYAVYENRFLYMLLCYVRDFVAIRYGKIAQIVNTYDSRLQIKKTLQTIDHTLEYEVNLNEVKSNDPYLEKNNPIKKQLDKLDSISKYIMIYLDTPLMRELAKVTMLKPPITETNVLKLNTNFRGALNLYYYLVSYEGDGFTIDKQQNVLSPFSESIANEFVDTILMQSFLAYKNSLGLEPELKKRMKADATQSEKSRINNIMTRLSELKQKLGNKAPSSKEYMKLVNDHISSLEEDRVLLQFARTEIEKLTDEIAEIRQRNSILEQLIEDSKEEISVLNLQQNAQIDAINNEHFEQIRKLNEAHQLEIENIEKQKAIAEQEMQNHYESQKRQLQQQINSMNSKLLIETDSRETAEKLAQEYEDQMVLAQAQINALKYKAGLITENDDFTSKTKFLELEEQYKAFKAFFRDQWKATKKSIRRKIFSKNNDEHLDE